MQAKAEKVFLESFDVAAMTRAYTENAQEVVHSWWKLGDDLLMRYADGFLNDPLPGSEPLGYPMWWLQMVGSHVPGVVSTLLPPATSTSDFWLTRQPPPSQLNVTPFGSSHMAFTLGVGLIGILIGAVGTLFTTRSAQVRKSDGQSMASPLLK